MYKNITWFTLGWVAHKHGLPIAIEVARQLREKGIHEQLVDAPKLAEHKKSPKLAEAEVEFNETTNTVMGDKEVLEELLAELRTTIDEFGEVTVSDLYSMIGLPEQYLDTKRGWKNLNSVIIQTARDYYTLRLPRPLTLS